MKYLLMGVCLFVLAGCGGDTPVPAPVPAPTPIPEPLPFPTVLPSAAHWVMRPKTWAEYKIYRGKGSYDPDTDRITADPSSLIEGETIRFTNLETTLIDHPEVPVIARVWSPAGVQVDTVDLALVGTLVEMIDRTHQFIGEVANVGCKLIDPPESLSTIIPIPGETFTVDSDLVSMNGGVSPHAYQTRYRTYAVGVASEGFTDAVLTALVEQPNFPKPGVYNHIFADGEIAQIMQGIVQADNSINDLQIMRRVRTGENLPLILAGAS